jgi:hypothetical protein
MFRLGVKQIKKYGFSYVRASFLTDFQTKLRRYHMRTTAFREAFFQYNGASVKDTSRPRYFSKTGE